jgi:hypothetical protein
MDLFSNHIKAASFFPNYAPSVNDWAKKMTGKNGRGNPFGFSEADKQAIVIGLNKMKKDLLTQIKSS